jgi:lysophospholipase L1-like esterase
VNDQYRGRPATGYRAPFAALLMRAIRFAGDRATHVVVLSIPDWGATPFAGDGGRDRAAIGREIDRYNAINCDETAIAGAQYVDVTAVSRRALHDRTLIADDGLHPSRKMYAEWVRLLLPLTQQLLAAR